MSSTANEKAWAAHYKLPPKMNMMTTKELYVNSGTKIFATIEAAIMAYRPGQAIKNMDILDFGCGVGRVTLPFFFKHQRPSACVDVKPSYIEYLREVIPGANPRLTGVKPPLPFPDASFDVVYAISVWTHLNKEKGWEWLHEMARVLRPGGLALLSTSSYGQLAKHREHAARGQLWGDVSDDDLRREGIIFKAQNFPGMGGPYGCTVHDPEWVKQEWSKVMPVQETRIRAIGMAAQDLNIMIKP
jgi:SAM-dependent methyltransferase